MRGFTMFLVVFWHIMSNSFGLSDSTLDAFFRTFRMPMFFFVSGYIGYKAIELFDGASFIKLFKHKAFVQLVPTIIIYSIYQFVKGRSPLANFQEGLVGYWFTLALFELFTLYYISNFLLHKIGGEGAGDTVRNSNLYHLGCGNIYSSPSRLYLDYSSENTIAQYHRG